MRTALPLAIILFVAAACSSVRPVAIRAGDVCENCRQTIVDTSLAGEILEPNGLALKFKTVRCMAKYLHEHRVNVAEIFVTDFTSKRLVSARRAVFVPAEVQGSTVREYHAFSDVKSAVAFAREKQASPVDWPSVMQTVAAAD